MTEADTDTSSKDQGKSNNDQGIEELFHNLCAELNMDSDTGSEAWRSYTSTKQNYSLEGDQLHWLACALYVACRRGITPTVGQQVVLEGNGVSLTRLLRSTKLSLVQFFNKARLWADMCNLNQSLREKIDKLERNFAVSNVIFKKYQPIFVDLFKDPSQDPPKVPRSRKQKRPPCTPGELFDFCWTLFIRVKGDFPSISDDLVNSYHLLLSCIDYIYSCAWIDKRDDLLNSGFDSGAVNEDVPCILDKLCTMHDGIINEVKSIREHWWKPYIKNCFEKKLLISSSPQTVSGILDQTLFENNVKNIRRDYETYVLSIGEYDERVFLYEEAPQEIGTPTKLITGDMELGEKIGVARRNLQTQFSGSALIPCTPLSGRHYLKAREQSMVTPVSIATYLVSRLNKMVEGRKPEPSVRLSTLLSGCSPVAVSTIMTRVERMGVMFTDRYTKPSDSHPGSHASFAAMRLRMGQVLYYRVLESILTDEQAHGKSVTLLVERDVFHQALFAACLEVVIFSYNSQRTFPWVLETFKLEAFYFYKVIEVLIRAEDGFARDVVKHLQRIEEQILESKAWASTSPVWEVIAVGGGHKPSTEEVSLQPGDQLGPPQSPLSHIRSPIVGDRFKSPVVSRRLFSGAGQPGQSVLATNRGPPSPMKSGLLGSSTGLLGSTTGLLGSSTGLMGSPSPSPMKTLGGALKTKKTNSLGLFFRKVYHLAHLRLDNLCTSLQVEDEIKRRIWTCLEYCLRSHTEMMKDRHLDQVIMCTLYIVCKVSGRSAEKNFTDIMKHYRNQPQAASHVYRSVLLTPRHESGTEIESGSPPTCPPTPGRMANSSTVTQDGEERGDLIKFYNSIYRHLVQEFALRFKRGGEASVQPPLSPLPQLRANTSSPCRKVSDSHSVFIRPLKPQSSLLTQSPVKPLSYSFSRSPAKDLAAINEMMREAGRGVNRVPKRLLVDEDEPETPAEKVFVLDRATAGNNMVELVLGSNK